MRRVLAVLGVAAGLAGCTRREPPNPLPTAHAAAPASKSAAPSASAIASAPASIVSAEASNSVPTSAGSAGPGSEVAETTLPPEERTWIYPDTPLGRMVVVVALPERKANERLPLLIAMHGRGEALKGPDRGARGWIDDYDLLKGVRRLQRPPLRSADFKSFVTQARLQRLNDALHAKRYRGLVVACPYTPDMLQGDDPFSKAQPLASFLVDELLPRLYRETPAVGTSATTGIDGVSLGGRAALSVGLLRPRAFGVVAGLQAAFDSEQAPFIAGRASAAVRENPALRFRLFTSEGDYFRNANGAIAQAMRDAGLNVRFEVLEGPHDYDFNRGPGALEMLLFHDRALRGELPP